MFKDFTSFNRLNSLLFKDEPFALILKAFTSFQNLLAALRTEAYDYATWYNKIMRDKYEDGVPVDVTDLPYLSVPRSQLAVIRARIAKVKETVNYAANAITNIALGNKVANPTRATVTTDDVTVSITATESSAIMNALRRIQIVIGDLVVGILDGTDSIVVNGVNLSVSPIVSGSFTLAKWGSGNEATAALPITRVNSTTSTMDRLRALPGEIVRRIAKTPLVVARSVADLACTSRAPFGVQIASLTFFGKKLLVWAESDTIVATHANKLAIFNATVHAKVINSGDEKSTIASSLYGYLSEDYVAAMSYVNNNIQWAAHSFNFDENTTVITDLGTVTNNKECVIAAPLKMPSESADVYTTSEDVTQATTQTAIADLFFTQSEWDDLESSLSEA